MIQIVSITDQGQITIPKIFRDIANIGIRGKAIISPKGDALIVKPISNFFSLKGAVKPKNRPENFKEMRKMFIGHLGKSD